MLLEELGEENARFLTQELADQELTRSPLVEEVVERSVSEEEEEEEEEYADGWSASEEEEEEEEEYEEKSVVDEEFEPEPEFDLGTQSSGCGWQGVFADVFAFMHAQA